MMRSKQPNSQAADLFSTVVHLVASHQLRPIAPSLLLYMPLLSCALLFHFIPRRSWRDLGSNDHLWQSLQESCPNPMLNHSEVSGGSCNAYGGCSAMSIRSSGSSWSQGPSFKQTYAMGQNWRRGRGGALVAPFAGSSWNSASRLHTDGAHVVLASAGLGSVDVVDIATGQRCSQCTGIGSQHKVG